MKRIGAVSPAARDTCRITPVRMPLIELGSTIVRIVCQRVAPMFQQASRNDIGTTASASRVLVMITGSVITASVQEAASSDRPMPANSTNAPTPNSACTMLGTPARFTTARLIDPREPVVAGVLVQVDAGQDADRRGGQQRNQHQEERADQRRPDAAGGHAVRRVVEQERNAQHRPALTSR